MKPKMQSAIERITLNDATFTGELKLPTREMAANLENSIV